VNRALAATASLWLLSLPFACSSSESGGGAQGPTGGASVSPPTTTGGAPSNAGGTPSTNAGTPSAQQGGTPTTPAGGVPSTAGGTPSESGGAPAANGGSGGSGPVPTGGAPGGSPGTGGSGGQPDAGGAPPTFVEPQLVTSAQNAYWKVGTLTEVASGTAGVTVNDASTFQKWDGFGGTFNEVGWAMLQLLSETDRKLAIDLLFGVDGARFAFGRVPIGSSDYALERYTLNEKAGDFAMESFSIEHDKGNLIPYIQAALAVKPDIRLWASPWTPPTWMKTNAAFDGGNMKDDDQTLGAHALYLAKFVEEYAKVGIKIEAIHPQNEPGYETRYPSCLWTAELMTKFIRDFLGPTFEERQVPAQIFLGTMSNADAGKDGTIVSTVLADTGAMKYVKGFGLQWNMINTISSLKSSNLPIVQSEHKCGNYPWETATFNATTPPNDHAYGVESWGLIVDWITAGATSYSAWNMVLDKNGHNLDTMRPWPQNALLWVDKDTKKLNITPAYYVFRHVSEFVDPGATRVATTGGSALAFKNPDGTLVLALFNSGGAKKETVSIGGKLLQFDVPGNGWATVNWK
jgi:glucosylceramidase